MGSLHVHVWALVGASKHQDGPWCEMSLAIKLVADVGERTNVSVARLLHVFPMPNRLSLVSRRHAARSILVCFRLPL